MATHTYAVLEVPGTVYAAVRALMGAAYYHHAFHKETAASAEVIDMHGIALQARPGSKMGADITVSTLLSSQTREGRVELSINGEVIQMELGKCREIVKMLNEAIEAAVSDELVFKFLTTRIGLDADRASAALLDFRELRQGSMGAVFPS